MIKNILSTIMLFLAGCASAVDTKPQPPVTAATPAIAPVAAVPATPATPAQAPAVTPASTAQPNVHILAPLTIPVLNRQRTIRLYLPPGYETSRRHYPVLYMHDGQILFAAATSYGG